MKIVDKLKRYLMLRRFKNANKSLQYLLLGNCAISNIKNFEIGNGCRIGEGCLINAGGGLKMGSNVILAPNVVIWTQNHNFSYAELLPYDSKIKNKKVTIGNNCWFGEGVKISPGVTIGEGSILAMGSVIFDDIPPYSIVRGNPARVESTRTDIRNYKALDTVKDSYIINKLKRNSDFEF